MKVLVGIVILFAAAAGYWIFFLNKSKPERQPQEAKNIMSEAVEMQTKDGVKIAGDYYEGTGIKGVLLLHMMPADRKSWTAFAQKLQTSGFTALAIDLRGHGGSQGGPDGYKKFSDAEHRASRLDAEAGAEFLKAKGVSDFHFVGASIGANLALEYLANHQDAKSAILLSPGLDYRGLETETLVSLIRPEQGLYLAASNDDAYSFDTVQKLAEKIYFDDRRVLKIFENSGHGTAILEKNPEFMDELTEWLKKF